MSARRAIAHQADLFAAEPQQPEGFRYRGDIISPAEERALVEQVAAMPFKPFEFHGYLGKRRIVSFGYRYDYGGRKLETEAPLPEFLLPLRAVAAAFAGLAAEELQHALVTEYASGAGIGWHRDKAEFADVIAISLMAPATLRFRRKHGAARERVSRLVEARSAYLLRGPARQEWQHSIPPLDRLRYSITFRSMTEGRR